MSHRNLTTLSSPQTRLAEQHEWLCATCGRVHAPAARFCSNCGVHLDAFDTFFGAEETTDQDTILAPTMQTAKPVPNTAVYAHATRQRQSGALADPSACALLSFFFPGAGQMLARQWIKGAFLVTLAYLAVRGFHLGPFELVMLAGRVLCAADAAGIARRRQAGRTVAEWDWAISSKPEKQR